MNLYFFLRSVSSKTDLRFGYISCKRSSYCLGVKRKRATIKTTFGSGSCRHLLALLSLTFSYSFQILRIKPLSSIPSLDHHDLSQWWAVFTPLRENLRKQWLGRLLSVSSPPYWPLCKTSLWRQPKMEKIFWDFKIFKKKPSINL